MSAAAPGSTIDLEKELTCSICTDVFFQPLTLLDCLHTFCGSCLKEWFHWQATAATHNPRAASPYTCPSCRAPVRAARPNANVTTLLDMYLQANPAKGKTETEKAEMRRNYKPGDNVIPPVEVHADSEDSDDERLLDEIRQMSVADLDPAVAANRRGARNRDNRRRDVADARRRQEAVERNVAHQPSLRSLLGASGEDSTQVQEIISSILSSGALDGIDLDNLTAEQEDELAERITEAYHSRHATRAREHRSHDSRSHAASTNQSTPPRSRPVSRPHLIDQWTQETTPSQRAPEQRPRESSNARSSATEPPPATRSSTDPATRSNNDTTHRRRAVPPPRSSTDSAPSQPRRDTPTRHTEPHTPPVSSAARRFTPPYPIDGVFDVPHSSPLAPSHNNPTAIPTVACNRCGRSEIQHDLHYHCDKCSNGDFDLCIRCYRAGAGCNHWFGFGYTALTRWQRNAPPEGYPPDYESPHVLIPRRYVQMGTATSLQQGAFCERCHQYADQSYWHCNTCFEGAWGFCSTCVQQEKHCTHLLAPLTQIHSQTAKESGLLPIQLPHLPNDYYFSLPAHACAVCTATIPANHTRYHCTQCNNGDYDICNDSYFSLVSTGKISAADGPRGQRRCLQGHPLSVVVYRNLTDEIKQRVIVSGPIGGWQARHSTTPAVPSDLRVLALWSWWPAEGVEDELAFPKYAEITEAEQLNTDYYVGVYAGMRGLFPANHVKAI